MQLANINAKHHLAPDSEKHSRVKLGKVRNVIELGAHSLKVHRVRAGSIHTVKHPYRLGHEVYTTGHIHRSTTRRIIDLIASHGLQGTVAIGTSAMRDADNQASVVRQIQDRLGIVVHVLQPWEEASLLATGYLWRSRDLPALVADLGGGSLEFVFLNRTKAIMWDSLPIGAIRLYERGLQYGLPDQLDWTERQFARALIINAPRVFTTGGTAAAIAKTLHHADFDRNDLERLETRVRRNGPPPGLKPDRARVFLCGLVVMRELLLFSCAERLHYVKISIGRVYLSLAALFGDGECVKRSARRIDMAGES